jgi:hypothetical protein
MKRTTVVTMGALLCLGPLAACSSAAPPPAQEPAAAAEAAASAAESPAERFDRECGASTGLQRVLEKPLASMGRDPELAALLDSGLLVAGERESPSLVSTPTRSVVVVRLGEDGTVKWEISLVHPAGRLEAHALVETADGGFAVLGRTELTREGRGYGWLQKLSADGKILWRDFFDAKSGMDAERADRFVPQLAAHSFDRLAVADSGRFVVAGADATAEIDPTGGFAGVTPGATGGEAAGGEPAAQLLDGGLAVVATLTAPELERSCLKLRLLDADGALRAEEPLAAEPQRGDRPAVAALGAYRVAVAFADVAALQLVVFRTER